MSSISTTSGVTGLIFYPPIRAPSFYQPTIYYNSPLSMNPAGNGQLLIGYADGHVYSFDPDKNAVTLLEDLVTAATGADGTSSGLLWFVGGFLNNRIASYDSTTTKYTALASWVSDTVIADTGNVAVAESSIWDFDLPEQQKILDGFSVVCDIPTGSDYVTISYQIDQNGTWVDVIPPGQTYSVDSSATNLYHYLPVSTSAPGVTFSTVQFRTTISGAPHTGSVTAEARVADFSETWTIDLLLRDRKPGARLSNNQDKADELRHFLWTSYRTKAVLAFQDAYISKDTGGYATPSGGFEDVLVTIESIEDIIDQAGEGKARVTLRKVKTDAS